ncbi:hypothetical protein HUJ05_007000 [Dendroctonus ponderosae]|nr:hypothetical protein HUJ05_007000 [Dendroctonus ponderosae]
MGFLIVTARSLIWMLLSLLCALMMLSALLSPVWITAATQNAMVDNETVTYTPSLGVYARCGRPIGRNHPICTLMSAKGLGADSEVYPTVWKAATVFLIMGLFVMGMTVCTGLLSCCVQSVFKKSIFTLSGAAQCVAGICFILGVMLHPMAWGVERAHKLCGKESSPFYLGDCSIGTGLFVAVGTTILTFVCACLSVPAETSTSSDKVQDKIYEGQTSTADHKDFHTKSVENDTPFLYCLLSQPDGKPLSCPPAMRLVTTYRNGQAKRYLLRGDSEGSVLLWAIPDISTAQLEAIRAQAPSQPVTAAATLTTSLTKAWSSVRPDPVGALDQVERQERQSIKLTASIYLPLQSRLVVGREDGTIVIVPATQTVMLQLLHGNHQQYHRIAAEEVLYACEENEETNTSSEMGLANPAVHFFRGLRHRNLSAIRHATQRGLHQLQQLNAHTEAGDPHARRVHGQTSLGVQGFRTNPKDPESHILFFDIEALIIELLSEEYAMMSPGSLEAAGLISQAEYLKVAALTQSASPDAHKKIADFFGKVKDKAENMERIIKEKDKHGILAKMKEGAESVQTKIQAKAELVLKGTDINRDGADSSKEKSRPGILALDTSYGMEIAQLLLSLLHSWGLDDDLDRVCQVKLGLLRPMVPLSFGVLSKANHMSLFLPTWHNTIPLDEDPSADHQDLEISLPPELVRREKLTRIFTSRTHWELSTTLTSNHLLAVIALSHTLMSMSSATFVPEQERNRKLHRQSRVSWSKTDEEQEEMYTQQQAQIKQGWSLLATLHCVLLPDKVIEHGAKHFKRPQVEMMAKRWQHHCVEVREAAQTLLLAELSRMGPKGRKQLVDAWAQYLPLYTQTETINQQAMSSPNVQNHVNSHSNVPSTPDPGDEEFEEEEEEQVRKPSSLTELKRKQSTAVILLGVIGAEFGQDIIHTDNAKKRTSDDRRKSSVVEGFGSGNNNLARLTAMALSHLLLAPPSPRIPAHIPLRRAAIDLIGRGFTVWEPFLDTSKVLLGLLELCSEADKLVPSMTYGLPLTPQADSCRTARHALTLIATARPKAFITTMAKEVARYNAMQQNAQTLNINMSNNVLHKAKPEILRGVELLIEKMQTEMSDHLVQLMDIILHCLDPSQLKNKGLQDVFPAVCKFNQVSHCPATRRIAVGSHTGSLTIYELRQGKNTTIAAHSEAVTACAFSPDGKFLVSYACSENRLSFWQTSTGMFGLGQSQTKNVKSYSTAPIADVARLNPMRLARLIWINNRTVTLMLADGSETRFNV